MSSPFMRDVYESIRRIWGWVLTIIGICVSGYFLFFKADDKVEAKWTFLVYCLCFCFIAFLVDFAFRAYTKSRFPLPRVIFSTTAPPIAQGAACLLLLEPSDLFSHDVIVSIYCREAHYEELIGYGRVLTIQTTGQVQVLVTHIVGDPGAVVWEGLIQNNRVWHDKVLVKPFLTSELLLHQRSNV